MSTLTKADLPQEMKLTAEEKRLLVAYRTMDDIGRVKALLSAEDEAAHYPRRAAPALRLVGSAT